MSRWTFGLCLGYLERRPSIFFNYRSAEEFEALVNYLATRIPSWLQELSTISGMARALPQQRKGGMSLAPPRRLYAELALVHLAGNSDLDALARELRPDDDQRALLDEFVAYLRSDPNVVLQ